MRKDFFFTFWAILFLVFFLFFFKILNGQQLEKKDLPAALSDELPFRFFLTASGKILITGTVSNIASDDAYLSRHDSSGNFKWAKMIGGGNYDYFQKAIEYNDEIICGGNSSSFGQNFQDFYLVKFDENGDTIWTKILGGKKYEKLMDFIQSGNHYSSIGYSNSFGSSDNNDVLLISTDFSGIPTIAKSYEASGEDIPHSIIKSADSGFIIIGNTTSAGGGMKDIFCIKTDSLNNLQWSKSYGGAQDEDASDLIVENGNIYITGFTKSSSGTQDLWIIKLDSTGNIIWNKVVDFGLDEKGNKLFYKNGMLYICGYMQSTSGTTDDIFVLTCGSSGENISAKVYPISGSEFGNFIGESQGKLFAAGFKTNTGTMKIFELNDLILACNPDLINFDTSSIQATITDSVFSVKAISVDSLFQFRGGDFSDYGNPVVNVEICFLPVNPSGISFSEIRKSKFRIFPNPGNGSFIVTGLNKEIISMKIINQLGENISSLSEINNLTNSEIVISNLPNGFYFFQIISTNFIQTEKIVIGE